jgi:penicillin G amidase
MRNWKHILWLIASACWIFLILKPVYGPLDGIGKLLSYPNGILFLQSPSEDNVLTNAPYQTKIYLDELGVPSIVGETTQDVVFGLGYMHARDRFFQMEMIIRTTKGELSELLGELTLERDKFWKPLQANQKALDEWAFIQKNHPEEAAYIRAYNEGIQFYLTNEQENEQFFEYKLLGEQPMKWEEHYPFLLSSYMSYMLAYNDDDLAWAINSAKLPSDLLSAFSTISDDYPFMFNKSFSSTPEKEINSVSTSLKSLKMDSDEIEKNLSKGSNAWVVSASQSKNGNALLSNDTHLDITAPNPWYQVHLICKDFHVQGFSIPCVPLVLSGNNENISWGITNAHWDEVDIFKLKVQGENYRVDSVLKPFKTVANTIKVKGQEDYVFESKFTEFGIVREFEDEIFAEKWHALDFNSSILSFYALLKAQDWNDFDNALKDFAFPPQNFVYADKKGNIGMMSAGKLPLKPVTYNGEILDGTTSYTFEYVKYEDLPKIFYGDSSFASTTNQYQAKTNYYFNYLHNSPYRAYRIQELLASNSKHTIEDMQQFQTDKQDLSVAKTLNLFQKLKLTTTQANYIQSMLSFDGKMEWSSKEAVSYFYLHHALRLNFEEYMTKTYAFNGYVAYHHLLDNVATQHDVLLSSIDTAVVWYNRYANNDAVFGEVNPFVVQHLLRFPGLGKTITEKGGSSYTLDVNGSHVHGASMRSVIEMGDTISIYSILAGGQSGRVNSVHYLNQLELWSKGTYHTIEFNKDFSKLKPQISFQK